MKLPRLIPSIALSLFCFLAAAAQAHRDADWRLVDLGVLSGGQGFGASALNNRGDVVGVVSTLSGCCTWSSRALLWQSGTLIDIMPPGTPPNSSAQAVAVSDRGTAIFNMDMGRIFMWRDGVSTLLPFAGVARNINKHDAVVGNMFVGFSGHAFLFQNGVLHDLGTLGGIRSEAFAVNQHGMVVGNARTAASADHAFVWQNGVLRDIGTFGGERSTAFDVNDHGIVVGGAQDATGQTFAFTWEQGIGMRKLLDIPSNAQYINDRGDIVGNLTFPSYFLLSDGVLTRLESLRVLTDAGFTMFFPEGINERGWIVGLAVRANGTGSSVLLMRKGS